MTFTSVEGYPCESRDPERALWRLRVNRQSWRLHGGGMKSVVYKPRDFDLELCKSSAKGKEKKSEEPKIIYLYKGEKIPWAKSKSDAFPLMIISG